MHQKTVLQNGIRIVTEKIPYFHSVATGIWVNVGSRDEHETEQGITHFVEHMFFKGTEHRSGLDIAKELDAVGGFANAFTSKEQVCLHAKVLDSHLPLVTDILNDIFLNSVFDPVEIDRERQVILQEISMVEDTPDEQVHLLLQEGFWENNPLGIPIYGTAETVGKIDRDQILAYLQRTFHPERIILSAAGNLEHQAFVDLVAPQLEKLPANATHLKRSAPRDRFFYRAFPKELEQVHICLALHGCSNLDETRFTCHLLNVILGGSMSSRLFQEIREKRALAYSVYSFVNSYEDSGLLGVYAGVSPDKLNETLKTIHEQLLSMANTCISESELSAAKEHLKGSMYLNAESTDSRMNRLAKNELLFGRVVPFEEVEQHIDQVSVDDIQEWFRSVFQQNHVGVVLLGPVDPEAIDIPFFK